MNTNRLQALAKRAFLSCLFGSERISPYKTRAALFLSCLFGSEQKARTAFDIPAFLSCLFGSELHAPTPGR